MGCHGVAQQFGGDFSFLAAAAGVGKPVGAVPPSDLTPEQLMENNRKLHLRRAQYLFHRVP